MGGTKKEAKNTVIAIGALGGSGTRAVAQVLMQAGVYMGDDLNASNDNLIFTRLFKNPPWYQTASAEDIAKRLSIFNEYMETNRLSRNNWNHLIQASRENKTSTSNVLFYLRMIGKLYASKKERSIWGWKEPNTQLYLREIVDFFPHLKYIHVIRNGLDMAFSSNKQQLKNWGYKYDLTLTGSESKEAIAIKQLNFWIESTREVLSIADQFGDHILLLNYSSFYLEPKEQIDRLLTFIKISPPKSVLNKLYQIPENKNTNNRYKNYNINMFNETQLAFVKEMGFQF